ncbi:MAG TPA: hypothetical protein VMW38_13375 [Terriglobia bacterium]|nr:hypothetical protein [Terriglobia bacterium]
MNVIAVGAFLTLSLIAHFGTAGPQAGGTRTAYDQLYRGLVDPPHEYSIRPFWFWNGKLDKKEVERQIEEMASQGVYRAYAHNRTGLDTPYLSEEYFFVVEGVGDSQRFSVRDGHVPL